MGHLLTRNAVRHINMVVCSKTFDLYKFERLEPYSLCGAGLVATSKYDFPWVGIQGRDEHSPSRSPWIGDVFNMKEEKKRQEEVV